MHILSELRNPIFSTPERQRALRALQMAKILKDGNTAKIWLVVKNMIERAVAEHSVPSNPTVSANLASLEHPYAPKSSEDDRGRLYADQIPSYIYQNPGAAPLQPQQHTEQNQLGEFDWEGLNIGNIMGDIQPTPGVQNQNQEFDWVSTALFLFSLEILLLTQIRASGALLLLSMILSHIPSYIEYSKSELMVFAPRFLSDLYMRSSFTMYAEVLRRRIQHFYVPSEAARGTVRSSNRDRGLIAQFHYLDLSNEGR
jgi:hypothetical protein